ncbi:MAG: T9SS type A sorting domain-containing protein, partial [Bacteroidota bacterium]|nr:T9SS type A sorting domain-containing protein [Bacteroidota bacterium]
MKRIAVTICLFLFALQGAAAQPNLNFKRVTVNWPTVELYFSVGCNGAPAYNMAKQDFTIKENGVEVPDFTLWCPDPSVKCGISTALVFDASGSMAGQGNTSAKEAGRAFIDEMDGVIDEATIIWFNSQVTIAQQMTTLKPLLYSAVDGLPAGGGTALWDGAYAGVLELINNGVNQCRAVIVMADGADNGSSRTVAEVISLANRHRIRVFTIGLGVNVNANEMQQVAQLTGGRYYQTPNATQMAAIYAEITTIIFQGFQECVITYERDCADGGMRTVELSLVNFCGGTDTKTKTYRAPLDSTTFSDLFMRIGDVAGSQNSEVTVPIDLLTPIDQKQFYPLAFTLLYDTTYLKFKSIDTPLGSLLHGMPLSITPDSTGLRIQTLDRRVIDGTGRLFDVTFTTKAAPDSTEAYVDGWNPVFEQGCFIPRFVNGTVTLYDGPVISPSGPLAFCVGDSVRLVASSGFTDYRWSTGDSTQSIIVRKAGVYWVTARNSTGTAITSGQVLVSVIPSPAPRLTVSDTLRLCTGATLELGVTDTTGLVSYHWSNGSRQSTTQVLGAGEYWVEVVNATGCAGSSDTLTVITAPIEATLNLSGVIERCAGDSLVLDAGSYDNYLWSNGATTRRITVRQSGTYFAQVTNAAGCDGSTDTAQVTILPAPMPEIQPPGGSVICHDDSVTLDAGDWVLYNWSNGATTRTITVHNSGMFTVGVTDSNGCYGISAPVTVTVQPVPVPEITSIGPLKFCEGDSVTLEAARGYASYLWSSGDTTRSITVDTSGTFSVTVVTVAGCQGRSRDVTVVVNPVPEKPPIVRTGDDLTTGPYAAIQWYLDGQPISGATQQSHRAVQTGTYTVAITNGFGCRTFSDPFPVGVLDVDAPVAAHVFQLYPDPNDGTVNLVLRAEQPVAWEVTVSNLLGQRMYLHTSSRPASQVHHTVDLRSVPRGMYLLRLRAGDRVWTRRIIR